MTFREALQTEINLQGLSVAQVAKDSKVSKGAIYNILNGTTEDVRIRPATRKALARACNRDVMPDGNGVVFVETDADPAPRGDLESTETVSMSWITDRPFLTDRHAGPAFDWLHKMEEASKLPGLRIVDRVFQNQPDFLSLALHNKGGAIVSQILLGLKVTYEFEELAHGFDLRISGSLSPGDSFEETVFVCAGAPYELTIVRAELTTVDGSALRPVVPETFLFPGGSVD